MALFFVAFHTTLSSLFGFWTVCLVRAARVVCAPKRTKMNHVGWWWAVTPHRSYFDRKNYGNHSRDCFWIGQVTVMCDNFYTHAVSYKGM